MLIGCNEYSLQKKQTRRDRIERNASDIRPDRLFSFLFFEC